MDATDATTFYKRASLQLMRRGSSDALYDLNKAIELNPAYTQVSLGVEL